MTDVASLRAEMEQDLAWRQGEIRFFQNQIAELRPALPLASLSAERRMRRALVLLLYAHFEGYAKFAFTVYVNAINASGITCRDAHPAIAAGSLATALAALRNPSSKCPEFRKTLPDDASLHLFAREREFVEQTTAFEARAVAVPTGVADPESNLKPVVLRKILFRLGLPHDAFDDLEGDIHRLLNYRNRIAHGEPEFMLDGHSYQQVRDSVFWIMDEITRRLTRALHTKSYQRHS